MPSQYVLYKGTYAALSTLASTGKAGVLAYTTDTHQVYVDTGTGSGIGTAWLLFGNSGKFIYGEQVAGSAHTWTLVHIPASDAASNPALRLFNAGAALQRGADYTITGAIVTTTAAIATGAVWADYQY